MDTALKQRLIGAIVLVALAVIFLPMLVKGPAPDSGVSDIPLKVPDAPEGQYETRELPLVAPSEVPANGAVGLDSAPGQAADASGPAALPASTAAGNYAVSFGAYASVADADAVIARLKQAGLPGYSEAATINGRPAWRVRVGPYADQATAEAVRLEAVKVRSDVKAQVVVLNAVDGAATQPATPGPAPAPASDTRAVASTPAVTTQPLPPEPTAPATAAPKPAAPKPAEPAPKPAPPEQTARTEPKPQAPAPSKPAAANVGFAVQLGAFSNPADADALRDRVRAGGYSAFVEQVRTDKGTLSRVRVGPVASRAEADALKAQVASKFGISGMVRPHP